MYTTDKPAYIEGEDIIFSITSVNVDDNTEFDWVILGDVDANDFDSVDRCKYQANKCK